jgi:Asp-tRNA(Asn)/Glu-tRNA(Gln) amidotransferase A subunit family amidase
MPFAPSLDTAGLFTQTADDMRLLWQKMGYRADTFANTTATAARPTRSMWTRKWTRHFAARSIV